MSKLRAFFALSFRAKVLVPVVGVMILLMAVSMWLVNRRVTGQLRADGVLQLETADAVFKNMQGFRDNYLFLSYRNLVKESHFQGLATLLRPEEKELSAETQKTIDGVLNSLVGQRENVADAIAVATVNGQRLAAVRDPKLDAAEFGSSCLADLNQALEGHPKVRTVKSGDHLFDVVTLPLRLNASDAVIGAISFGMENSVAREFGELTENDLVLLADGRVIGSTLKKTELQSLTHLLETTPVRFAPGEASQEILLDEEPFLCLPGWLDAEDGPQHLSYVILCSYEKATQTLRATQHIILLVSSLAIVLGTTVVCFLVGKVTKPLRELRDSAEAVGRGDFSRRVEVRYEDECGELAHVFNQMTENLKNSREQLEATVATLKNTQAQLIQSEKLSGIGEFIAGVAHELNNPLTSVMGFSELLQQDNTDPAHKRYLDMIHKSALRCQKIVQALLSFARRSTPERKPVCVNSLIETAIEILQYQLRTSNIECVTHLDPHLPLAMVDPHQVQQVFVNIINNARQAIEAHQPKGRIKVTTVKQGDSVRIIFQDNGPGISQENLSKIFDPFFTTKDVGKGTGLGLSLCYGIIKEHGGTITPCSKPGEGAVFIIELPITHETGEAPPAAEPRTTETESINPREGAGKRVLVVDDEEPILHMVREALLPRGYEVDLARDGESGLQKSKLKQYDLMLCDWKMPGLSGQQVYERLRAMNPALSERMIFVTGDTINDKTRKFLEQQNKICLPKPFTLAEFRAAISKVIAGK